MKKTLLTLIVALMYGCTATPITPDAQAVTRIQAACAADAALRPTVTALLSVPGLASPEQIAGLAAARAVIDPVCANPQAGIEGTALAAFSGAVGQVIFYVASMQAH